MNNNLTDTTNLTVTDELTGLDDTAFGDTASDDTAQDPAGGIRLSGRNRMCLRARALAGMVLTSGIVVALGTTDTTSSMHHNFIG